MKKKWKFNEQFLLEKLYYCEEILYNRKLDINDQTLLASTIEELENYLALLEGNDYNEDCYTYEYDYDRKIPLKVQGANILEEFRKSSDIIPYKYLNWILELSEQNLDFKTVSNTTFTYDIEKTVENSLEIYKDYFPKFYNTALSFLNYPHNLFHFEKNIDLSSFCFYSKFLEVPLFLINRTEGEDCFIHELQHGIEFMNYNEHLDPLYIELGPMVLERMYADKIYGQGKLESLSCYELELNNFKNDLEFFTKYAKILKEFKSKKFMLSNNEIYSLFEKYNFFYSDNMRETFSYFLDNDIIEHSSYVFSFLKSISLKNEIYENKRNADERLIDCSTSCYLPFYSSEREMFDSVDKHLKEVKSKQKILMKTKK